MTAVATLSRAVVFWYHLRGKRHVVPLFMLLSDMDITGKG